MSSPVVYWLFAWYKLFTFRVRVLKFTCPTAPTCTLQVKWSSFLHPPSAVSFTWTTRRRDSLSLSNNRFYFVAALLTFCVSGWGQCAQLQFVASPLPSPRLECRLTSLTPPTKCLEMSFLFLAEEPATERGSQREKAAFSTQWLLASLLNMGRRGLLKGGFSGWHPKRAAERKSKSGLSSHAEGLFEDKLLSQKAETAVCLSLGNLILFADSSSYEPLTEANLFFCFWNHWVSQSPQSVRKSIRTQLFHFLVRMKSELNSSDVKNESV